MTLRELLAELESLPSSMPDRPVVPWYRGGADDARAVRSGGPDNGRVTIIDTNDSGRQVILPRSPKE